MKVDTIIAGGKLVTPNRMFGSAVAIDGEKIVGVGSEETLPRANQRIDASGKLVMPGFIDPHVHFDEVPEEYRLGDYEAETAAAAVGGVTTCIDFAWQGGGPVSRTPTGKSLLEGIKYKKEKASKAIVDFSVHGGIVHEDPKLLEEFPEVIDEGVTSFKMLIAGGGEVYSMSISKGFADRALEHIAELDAVAMFHTEEPSILDQAKARLQQEGKSEPEWFPQSRPDYAEAMAADHAIQLAKRHGVKYYGVHTTCREAAEVIDRHQATDRGSQVRAETCTHYTALDESLHNEIGNLAKVGPPLRTPDDNDAMFEYLRNNVLSIVSSDNVTQKLAYKQTDTWWDALFGYNEIQNGVIIFHDEAINKRGFSYPFLVRVMSSNIAQTFGLSQKGTLTPGTDADIVIFDPDRTHTITADDFVSKAEFTIYDGREVTGVVDKTFVRGTLVADNGSVVGKPGDGQFIERTIPNWNM